MDHVLAMPAPAGPAVGSLISKADTGGLARLLQPVPPRVVGVELSNGQKVVLAILEASCRSQGTNLAVLLGSSQDGTANRARRVAVWVLTELRITGREIAALLGRSVGTVSHYIETIEVEIYGDEHNTKLMQNLTGRVLAAAGEILAAAA
jgi:hypothetical protein